MLRRNVIANFVGQGWTALMGFAFIPVYIRYLGIEAWGLVGFMTVLQAWLTLLGMGLAPTLNREMALFVGGSHTASSIRDLLHTLERVYGGVALVVLAGVGLAAPWFVDGWLNVMGIGRESAVVAVVMMGGVVAARLMEEFYRGAVLGLQHQVWLNCVQVILATLRWGGAAVLVAYVSPSIESFFLWQGGVSLLLVAILGLRVHGWLPRAGRRGRFEPNVLRAVRGFAGGLAGISVLTLLLTQVDKLLLSKLLSLEEFGYYMLAASLSGGLYFLVSPLATAIFPRLTELYSRQDEAGFAATYHAASQWIAVVLVPAALTLAVFAEPVLRAWMGDAALAQRVAPLLTLLTLGTLLHGFMHIPYMAQLAHGWTGFALRVNTVAVFVIVPAILWAVPRFGALGAAWVWLALNAGYVFLAIHFMHRHLMPNEKWLWYRRAVLLPVTVAGSMMLLAYHGWTMPESRTAIALRLIVIAGITYAVTALATSVARNAALQVWTQLFGRNYPHD